MTATEKYADKIAKLLRKAEDPNIPQPEAEAFFMKAQELMREYAIDEAMLASARGIELTPENVVEEQIHYHSTYSRAQFEIGAAIARANDCKVLVTRGKDLMRTTLWIVGLESDVARVKMLNSSIQIQSMASLTRWWATQDVPSYYTQRDKFKMRRTFLFGYAKGLAHKLALANERARSTATQHEMHRRQIEPGEAVQSVELVLRDRKRLVMDYYDEKYGGLRGKGVRYNGGGEGARMAGVEAGRNANVSSDPQVRRQGQREITR